MTTELVLLLSLFVFILGGVFLNDGPTQVFQEAAPRLGGRVEQHITFGHRFNFRDGAPIQWAKPRGAAPTGSP